MAPLPSRPRRQTAAEPSARTLTRTASRRLSEVVRDLKISARAIKSLDTKLRQHNREQDRLRRQMDYFALGQKITRTGSWAWNPSSGELFWSREHFRIFGLDPEDNKVSYRVFFRMIHIDERVNVEEAFQEAVRTACDFDAEFRIVRPDGQVRYVHSHAYPVFKEPGELVEYVGTVADITEQRQGEESLGSMQAELAQASRAMTLGQLMATIAHEVNQPLAALVANAGAALRWLAGDPPRIDKARQALTRIARDANRASSVIARIRALVGGTDVQRAPLDLNSIVQEVIVLVRTELRRNNITVRAQLAENLRLVRCDRVQMQQVILNLIVNAIEAMAAVVTRPKLLAIGTVADFAGVIVSVNDSGVGLDELVLERVFEPFYTTKPRGMGIGLAISRAIVEAHGGRIWAAPNEASGTTFRFRLPFSGAPAE
ncbi:MAG: histidine kinase [Gammaproteobacteria bacterium]|jgi:PAS domain S-box-containing protein|nr:histidine kinase [Gammaproteobacteria bacterium]